MGFSINKAKYKINVEVEFDVNGGDSISETVKKYSLGDKYTSFPSASKAGEILIGWFTSSSGGRKLDVNDEVNFTVKKLYAHYQSMTNFTSYEVTTTSSYKKFGIYSATLKSGSSSVYVDWGDGTTEEITGNISKKTHEYATEGTFIVKVSDNIQNIAISGNDQNWYETTSQVKYTLKKILHYSTSVTSIPQYGYYYCYYLNSISGIGDSNITSIPAYCFYWCYNLSSLNGLSKITSIGTYCFYYCYNLTTFTGLGNITSLPNYAFYNCLINSLNTLPTTVTSYGQYCLGYTRISDLSRVRTTDTLNQYCFAYMTSLTSVSTLAPRSSLPNYCFYYCTGLTTADFTNWSSLVSIPSYCFSRCSNLRTFTPPNRNITYQQYCFEYTKISDLTFVKTTDSLGQYCFSNLTALTDIDTLVPRSSLPTYCFYGCTSLTNVDFSEWNSLTSIPANCFYNNTCLTNVTFNRNLKQIDNYAFYNCYNYLKNVNLKDTQVTSLGNYAFCYNYNLTSISLPSSLTRIGNYGLAGCRQLQQISCYALTAPTVGTYGFGYQTYNSTYTYVGYTYRSSGNNTLHIKNGATGYDSGLWSSPLQNASYCGFHKTTIIDDPYDLQYGQIKGLSSWYLSTGSEINPDISVYSTTGILLTENVDWRKELANNINVGTAGISAIGMNDYHGKLESTFRIVGEVPTYTELEYIESSGTQWIDTGINLNDNTLEMAFYLFNTGIDNLYIFQAGESYTNAMVAAWSNAYSVGWNGNVSDYRGSQSVGKHILVYNKQSGSNRIVQIDNQTILTKSVSPTEGYTVRFLQRPPSSITTIPTRIYYAKLYNRTTGDIIFDMIPVKDPDGVVCMYNKVSNTFFYNQGTGSFIAGPEK